VWFKDSKGHKDNREEYSSQAIGCAVQKAKTARREVQDKGSTEDRREGEGLEKHGVHELPGEHLLIY
jgi:hypothetical protein